MSKSFRIMMFIGWLAAIGNIVGSAFEQNYTAMIAWFVAICWFPYQKVFAKEVNDDGR